MNLGKSIYDHRTRMNLSQGDLANILNISRQSVSKWENNNTVPDLEKLLKLSELFEVTLDELVKGPTELPAEQITVEEDEIELEPARESRKIAGAVLLVVALIASSLCFAYSLSLNSLLLVVPFVICSLICFIFKKNTLLMCFWSIYLYFDCLLRLNFGIKVGLVLESMHWTAEMNYLRLTGAWLMAIYLIILLVSTFVNSMKQSFSKTTKAKLEVTFGWILLVAALIMLHFFVFSPYYSNLLSTISPSTPEFKCLIMLLEWLFMFSGLHLFIKTVKLLKKNH